MDASFVGINVSKDRLDVHVCPSGEAFTVSRDGKGLEGLIDRLRTLLPQLIALEATGGFETIAAAALAGAGLPLVIVNPAQVRHFAQAVGKRAKTDPIDAAMIARFAAAVRPEVRPLPDEQARLLGELVARRRQIIEMIVAERQREPHTAIVRVRKSITRHIRVLEKELVEIDNDNRHSGTQLSCLARQGRPAGDLPRDRQQAGADIARRNAGARQPNASPDRQPCRSCSVHPAIRPLERQEHDRRRSGASAQCALHGCAVGDHLQSAFEELLSTPALCR
jgi:transposase